MKAILKSRFKANSDELLSTTVEIVKDICKFIMSNLAIIFIALYFCIALFQYFPQADRLIMQRGAGYLLGSYILITILYSVIKAIFVADKDEEDEEDDQT